MAWQSGLSRWSRFVTSLYHIDAAIEAADPSVSRDEFRRLRVQIAMLFGDAEDDARKTEELCVLLDGAMAKSLATLQTVPADAVPKVLASSAHLAGAVGWLRSHDSERVRGLAHDVIRGWKASVESDIARMTAAIAKLDDVSSHCPPCPSKTPAVPLVSGDARVKTSAEASGPTKMVQQAPVMKKTSECCKTRRLPKSKVPTKVSAPLPEKSAPVIGADKKMALTKTPANVGNGGRVVLLKRKLPVGYQEADDAKRQRKISVVPKKTEMSTDKKMQKPAIDALIDAKMEATRRKLREGYQAAEDAKRLRKILVIETPTKPVNQQHLVEQNSRRKAHAIVRERSQARCGGTSTTVQRSLMPSFR